MFGLRNQNNSTAHLKQIFRDMPWLWAVRSFWTSGSKVRVFETPDPEHADFMEYTFQYQSCKKDGETVRMYVCYVHAIAENVELVHEVRSETPLTMYDVLDATDKHFDVSEVKHIVPVTDGHKIIVWTDRKGPSFKHMYATRWRERNPAIAG